MKTIPLFCVFFLSQMLAFGQKNCSGEDVHKLLQLLKQKHYSPISIDDNFSKKLFHSYLQSIDDRHLLLLKSEITVLASDQMNLDDELNKRELKFINRIAPIYRNSLVRSKQILENLKTKGLQSIKEEHYIPYHKDTMNYATNDSELALRWGKYIMLQVYLKELQNSADSSAAKSSLKDIYLKILNKSLHKINKDIVDNINSLQHLYYLYAKCIPVLFDPHSNYLSYNDYQNFISMLSTDNYKFGITVDKNKMGLIEIVRVQPGTVAWKSGKINIGDVITHLKWQNGERIELSELDLQEVSELMSVSNSLYLEFTVKSAAGNVEIISLKKEKTDSYENSVKGYILTGKDNKKIGYICLPSFYTLFESENLLGCANDVAKELIKLQQENIEGLLFDLRSNGGGSLKEGLELCGIFINEGTLAIQREKEQPPVSLKDWNRGVAYAGPMVVLVNGHSASASELMASTLQDFNRAVIVGTNTYGKATGQELYPLNPTEGSVADSLKSGFVSVTVLKLYRVTGKSNQVSGLNPDIVLPDPFVNLYENESKEPEALAKDTVAKKTFYQALPRLPLDKVKIASESRTNQNENFMEVKKLVSQYEEKFEIGESPITLSSQAIKNIYHAYNQWQQEIKKHYYPETTEFTVKTTNSDEAMQQLSVDDRLLSEYSMKRLKNDLTIEESYLILKDLINNK